MGQGKGFSIEKGLSPLTRFLAQAGITPSQLTFFGTLLTLWVPYFILRAEWAWAGVWMLVAGFFDVLDGALARNEGMAGRFGAFWDSALDRVSEAIVCGGLLAYYFALGTLWDCLLVFAVFTLSVMVSYTRARAEGLDLDCKVGILPRPGRVVLLSAGFIFGYPVDALILVGILSLVTVLQRIHWVWVNTRPVPEAGRQEENKHG